MASIPPMPTMPEMPKQESEEEIRARTQQEALDAERKRKGRQETILTSSSGDTSTANVRKKTLLGE